MKIICKKCGDDKSVRNGYSKRKNGEKVQKYRCNKCNGYFILNPSIKRMDEEDKKRLEDMINEGIGKRKIQRLLGYKSVTTVLNYLKKSKKLGKDYKKYISDINRMNGIKKLIIDEMYSYVGSKLNRCYIWTGLVLHDNQKYPVFHISKTKGINDLDEFVRDLPNFDIVYSDKNPVYKEYYGKRNISQKGIETNLVESLNSQLRHYCSQLIRRTKTYAKCMVSLNANLIQILFDKLLKST